MACNRITAAITRKFSASGRSRRCSIPTTRPAPRATSASTRRDRPLGNEPADRCHVNWVVLDSDWEAEFCRVAESHPQGPRLREEPQPRPRSAVPLRLRDSQVSARLHRAGGRRPRRRRPAASRRRDQGLPARGREGEEIHDGHLLGARREPSRHATAAGRSPSSPRSTRSKPTSRRRSKRVQQDDRVRRVGAQLTIERTPCPRH